MPKLYPSLFFFLLAFQAFAQLRISEAEILIQSRHVWRGEKLGTAPAFEPSITFESGRLSLNCWASLTSNSSYSEFDLIASYQSEQFELGLFDYYNPVPGENNKYFNFQQGFNRHSIELGINNFSVGKHRLKWMMGVFLFGDRNDETGNPFYSTYLEINYPFLLRGVGIKPFAGITPFRGYYADRPAFINTGVSFVKEPDLKLPFDVPLSVSFISNPYTKQSFVIFAAGIAF